MAHRTTHIVYGLSAIDASGRVVDQAVMRALGWPPQLALSISENEGVVTICPEPGGRYRVTGQGNVRIPAPLRHRCALAAGDRVLLAATPDRSRLTIYSPAALDRILSGGDAR